MDEEPVLQCTAALQLAALAPALDHKHDYFASGGAADNVSGSIVDALLKTSPHCLDVLRCLWYRQCSCATTEGS